MLGNAADGYTGPALNQLIKAENMHMPDASRTQCSPLVRVVAWLAGALLVVLCSCSPGGDPALCGKWQAKEDPKHVIEIRGNGGWVEGEKDPDITGMKWSWDGTNHIRITAHSKLVGEASGRMKVALNGDTLTLSDSDGATEYTRVK